MRNIILVEVKAINQNCGWERQLLGWIHQMFPILPKFNKKIKASLAKHSLVNLSGHFRLKSSIGRPHQFIISHSIIT